MRTLAIGKSQKCICKLLRVLINVSQSTFGDLDHDTECIRDIADVITADLTPTEQDTTGKAAQNANTFNTDPIVRGREQ